MERFTQKGLIVTCVSFAYFITSLSQADTGIALTLPLIPKDPSNTHGYRIAGWVQPKRFNWFHTKIYFNASFGHWWVSNNRGNHSLSIYALAPVLRHYMVQGSFVSPFIDLSVGPAWMTRTRFDTRNLGIHFAFQDEVGLGAEIGKQKKLLVILSALHYSNASFSSHNAGITIPVLLTVAWRMT